jgi:hypothetical protein
MRTTAISILLFWFICMNGISQQFVPEIKPPELKKNVFYGTLGIDVWEFYGTILANYERMLYVSPKAKGSSLWLRAGAGPFGAWGNEGWNYVSTISVLTGKKSSHAEFGLGALLSWDTSAKHFAPLLANDYVAANIGYRYQKPGGSFIFRAGIGWPEFTYISFGFCL